MKAAEPNFVAALQQLEEKYRAPLARFYLGKFFYQEMAEVLELPIGTILSRMSRGKEMLRRRLQSPSPIAISCANPTRNTAWTGRILVSIASLSLKIMEYPQPMIVLTPRV